MSKLMSHGLPGEADCDKVCRWGKEFFGRGLVGVGDARRMRRAAKGR